MGKMVPISVIDKLLDKVATANLQVACSAQPTNRDDAVTAFSLAQVSLDTGDFTKETVNAKRNLLIAEKADVAVDTSGSVSYITLCDDVSILAITTVNDEYLSSGDQYTFPAWTVNISVA